LPIVVGWALRQTGNREVAADLSAEVFAAALGASSRYRPGRGPVNAWLLGIAPNKLLESRRRGVVEDSARQRLHWEAVELTDADLQRVEELASVGEEVLVRLASLPEDQRDAVVGRVIEERSYGVMASQLGCSESVIRQRVSRGLKALRSPMERQ
jgi:RNA polymerase sigma factor (sigma-70 family)